MGVMKIKMIIAATVGLLVSQVSAEVRTFQGSTRWATTFFRTNTNTAQGKTTYATYFVVETNSLGDVINQSKIDAWSAKNPTTGRTEKLYYVDNNYQIEYGYFGIGGTSVAGGMLFDGLSATMPFRGTLSSGGLGAFALYPTADYYPLTNGLDVTEVTGSARLNSYFSGNVSTNTAVNAIADYLESRGYLNAN